ncbi:hypothetical protein GCM10011487_15150 [Steroidobacter agaridevorans]|uniref:Haem-binding uptake Tiki superfamily ChaN domain-containing protein n=2 Tax=Steroidobacter agaridevorans TaxID=2695856 RepID=A0A829Y901_9GAMM|nr:hypothetical protein GCM10011487_15150 [Steroidobacter agaridevorans]
MEGCMRNSLVVLASALFLSACQAEVKPAPERITPWTTQLRAAQPDDAFAAVYSWRGQRLIFIGAKHATRTDSLTFRLIEQAYASFHVDTVIVEGPPYSHGANAERLFSWVEKQREIDGFVESGEIVPTVRGARDHGAVVWGGEPDDTEVRDRVLARGFTLQDLVGFYTLRSVPQWVREQKITGPDDSRTKQLIEAELERSRSRLQAPADPLSSYASWAQWYERTNGKPFDASFTLEEGGPLADGRYATNKISEAIGRVRDEFLLEIIARHLNARDNVLVVFGESHLMMLRPALSSMLGPPCYEGDDLGAAGVDCRNRRAALTSQIERIPRVHAERRRGTRDTQSARSP